MRQPAARFRASPLAAALMLAAAAAACDDAPRRIPFEPDAEVVIGPLPEPIFFPPTIPQISAGEWHACALTRDRLARCWGDNTYGQLGNGTLTPSAVPTLVSGGRSFLHIDAGTLRTCAIDIYRRAYCWGAGFSGSLGTGSTQSSQLPVAVAGGHAFKAIAVGASHTCALTTLGAAYCWGANPSGEVGNAWVGTSAPALSPVGVAGGHVFTQIGAGTGYTCGLLASGEAMCWGRGHNIGAGWPTPQNASRPERVAGGYRFTSLHVGPTHACGIEESSSIAVCWGSNRYGQLGIDPAITGEWALAPVRVGFPSGLPVESIAPGSTHTCATLLLVGSDPSRNWTCWGANGSGQLGQAYTSTDVTGRISLPPSGLADGTGLRSVTAGYLFSCGISNAGVGFCWGSGSGGRRGDGTFTSVQPLPTPLAGALSFNL